jgi:hypothetical protein
MLKILLALLVIAVAGCSSSAADPPQPALTGTLRTLQIDLAGCQPRTGGAAGAAYDGDLWSVPISTGIRCALPIQAGDTIVEWAVFGRRDIPGQQVTTACLHRLETVLTAAAPQHVQVGACQSTSTATQYHDGAFALHEQLAPPWPTTEDDVYSLFVAGSGQLGHRVGAATVYVMR